MDTKNVIAAIALSSAVIVLYSLFFIPKQTQNQNLAEKKKIEQNSDTPSLEQKETVKNISRVEALSQNERIIIFFTVSFCSDTPSLACVYLLLLQQAAPMTARESDHLRTEHHVIPTIQLNQSRATSIPINTSSSFHCRLDASCSIIFKISRHGSA